MTPCIRQYPGVAQYAFTHLSRVSRLLVADDCLLVTPSSASIMCSSRAWSFESSGAIDMSRTARNWPTLFRCSFSRRKKFQQNRLNMAKYKYNTGI